MPLDLFGDNTNLARASGSRRSWEQEFALANTCPDKNCGLANPHVWQRIALTPGSYPELDHLQLPRTLEPSARRRAYYRRQAEVKSTIHWGQRKLCLAELDLLTEVAVEWCPDDFSSMEALVVYAGAAPGSHLSLLCSLFPRCQFEAYDPRRFDPNLAKPYGPKNLNTYQECFTDETARSIARSKQRRQKDKLVFISDIRTADWQHDDPEDHDKLLWKDMEAQMKWVEILGPSVSLLKFRLPYTEGTTTYLKGDLRLPIWGPQTTTECRLLVKGPKPKTCIYDHKTIWEQLFYFNTVARVSVYPRDCEVKSSLSSREAEDQLREVGLDRCYDCAREVNVLTCFLLGTKLPEWTPQTSSPDADLAQRLCKLSCMISESCGRGWHGLMAVVPPPWQHSEQAPRNTRTNGEEIAARKRKR